MLREKACTFTDTSLEIYSVRWTERFEKLRDPKSIYKNQLLYIKYKNLDFGGKNYLGEKTD